MGKIIIRVAAAGVAAEDVARVNETLAGLGYDLRPDLGQPGLVSQPCAGLREVEADLPHSYGQAMQAEADRAARDVRDALTANALAHREVIADAEYERVPRHRTLPGISALELLARAAE